MGSHTRPHTYTTAHSGDGVCGRRGYVCGYFTTHRIITILHGRTRKHIFYFISCFLCNQSKGGRRGVRGRRGYMSADILLLKKIIITLHVAPARTFSIFSSCFLRNQSKGGRRGVRGRWRASACGHFATEILRRRRCVLCGDRAA